MKRSFLKNQKGQFAIEAVLLMLITIGALAWATNQIREGNYLAKLIGGPWGKVSGMIECGVWSTPVKARPFHPNQLNRSLTLDPST